MERLVIMSAGCQLLVRSGAGVHWGLAPLPAAVAGVAGVVFGTVRKFP